MEKNKALIISLSVVAGVLALSLIVLAVFMVAGRGQEAGDASGAETSDENAAEPEEDTTDSTPVVTTIEESTQGYICLLYTSVIPPLLTGYWRALAEQSW